MYMIDIYDINVLKQKKKRIIFGDTFIVLKWL